MMKRQTVKRILKWTLGVILPVLLSILYYGLRGNRQLMDSWVQGILKPVAQTIGRFWALFPISVAELITVTLLVLLVVSVCGSLYLTVKRGTLKPVLRVFSPIIITGLWIFALLNWMWNVTYYATGFAEMSGLDTSPYSVEELISTTVYFAERAAIYSTVPSRTENGHFIIDQNKCFHEAISVYENLEEEFPFLKMQDVRAKPLIFSHTQSRLGFTGIYFPFTGEANVNVDAPRCLMPYTIAHEMSHQRMVASEDEANFLGIAASVSSDNHVFQYSGYLMGLIQLSHALNSVSPEAWQAIWEHYATPELYIDWNDNYIYWELLESKVDEVATDVYDNFLKGNDQELGMQSYGACVDLLVAYYGK